MPAFSQKPHFISGARHSLSSDALKEPPVPCEFKLGDTVTFTNENGVVFHGNRVTGFAPRPVGERFIYLDYDCWWFPTEPSSLTLTHRAAAAL